MAVSRARSRADVGLRSFRCEFAVPIGGRDSAVHQEIAAGDKRSVRAHEERADGSYLIGSAGTSRRRNFDHAPIPVAPWPFKFVVRERSNNDSGADRID